MVNSEKNFLLKNNDVKMNKVWYNTRNMNIKYQKYALKIVFKEKVYTSLKMISIFRSILGLNLKSMCCIAKTNKCENCLYFKTCVYGSLFESVVSKENQVLEGRNTAPHPYILSIEEYDKNFSDRVILNIILIGKYIEYFPYVYGAFLRAGQKGFGKERIPFLIEDVTVDNESVIEAENQLKTNIPVKIWKSSDTKVEKNGDILIKLKTPLRYKTRGKLGDSLLNDIDIKDFMSCLHRRIKTLCGFYGDFIEEDDDFNFENCKFSIAESNIRWKENIRYSSRQKNEMSLGGMVGEFTLCGKFSQQDLDLIEFAQIFGAGKNTNFGLGQIDVWERLK